MTAAEFAARIAAVTPGETIIYYTGNMARERRPWTDRSGTAHGGLPWLDKLAKAVAKAAAEGSVTLVQRKIAAGVYEYRAVRSAPPAACMRGYSYGRRNIVLPVGDIDVKQVRRPAHLDRKPLGALAASRIERRAVQP